MLGLPGIYGGQQADRFQSNMFGSIVSGSSLGVTDPFSPDPVRIGCADRPGSDACQAAKGEQGAALHLHVEDVSRSQPLGHVRVSGP